MVVLRAERVEGWLILSAVHPSRPRKPLGSRCKAGDG